MSDKHLSWLKESAQVKRCGRRRQKSTRMIYNTPTHTKCSPPPFTLLSSFSLPSFPPSLLSQVGGKLEEAFQKFLSQTSKVLGAQKAVVDASKKQTQLVRDATSLPASPDDTQSIADTAGSKRESFISWCAVLNHVFACLCVCVCMSLLSSTPSVLLSVSVHVPRSIWSNSFLYAPLMLGTS